MGPSARDQWTLELDLWRGPSSHELCAAWGPCRGTLCPRQGVCCRDGCGAVPVTQACARQRLVLLAKDDRIVSYVIGARAFGRVAASGGWPVRRDGRELGPDARRSRRTVPTAEERGQVHDVFWADLMPSVERAEAVSPAEARPRARAELGRVVNPWLLRSRLLARSYLKPHGYPGDFRMVEWMYDLEREDCADQTQPAVINLLDGLFRSVTAFKQSGTAESGLLE